MGTNSKKLDCVLRYIADFTQTDKKTGKVLAWYKYNGIPSKLQTIMESKLYRLLGYRNDFSDHAAEMHWIISHWLFNTVMSEYNYYNIIQQCWMCVCCSVVCPR